MHLFAYGTLMCSDIMAEVSGLHMPSDPASLTGYRRLGVRGEHYPAILPDTQSSVTGVVYRDIPQSAWVLLDRFEGDMYSRNRVQATLADGSLVAADTYVIRDAFVGWLDDGEWDPTEFLRHGKERFRRFYKGYAKLATQGS